VGGAQTALNNLKQVRLLIMKNLEIKVVVNGRTVVYANTCLEMLELFEQYLYADTENVLNPIEREAYIDKMAQDAQSEYENIMSYLEGFDELEADDCVGSERRLYDDRFLEITKWGN
jgi:hypothetical protein